MTNRVAHYLLLVVGLVLYGIPFAIAFSYRGIQHAGRWSMAAVSLGWKEGLAKWAS